jgi:archaeosine-15-forming tRNA-guanine transglycosylase
MKPVFITLTSAGKKEPLYVNANQIMVIRADGRTTVIVFGAEKLYRVIEKPEEILQMIQHAS